MTSAISNRPTAQRFKKGLDCQDKRRDYQLVLGKHARAPVLKDDKREIFRAAADANRIAEWILSHHPAHAARDDDPDTADDEQPSTAPSEALAA